MDQKKEQAHKEKDKKYTHTVYKQKLKICKHISIFYVNDILGKNVLL